MKKSANQENSVEKNFNSINQPHSKPESQKINLHSVVTSTEKSNDLTVPSNDITSFGLSVSNYSENKIINTNRDNINIKNSLRNKGNKFYNNTDDNDDDFECISVPVNMLLPSKSTIKLFSFENIASTMNNIDNISKTFDSNLNLVKGGSGSNKPKDNKSSNNKKNIINNNNENIDYIFSDNNNSQKFDKNCDIKSKVSEDVVKKKSISKNYLNAIDESNNMQISANDIKDNVLNFTRCFEDTKTSYLSSNNNNVYHDSIIGVENNNLDIEPEINNENENSNIEKKDGIEINNILKFDESKNSCIGDNKILTEKSKEVRKDKKNRIISEDLVEYKDDEGSNNKINQIICYNDQGNNIKDRNDNKSTGCSDIASEKSESTYHLQSIDSFCFISRKNRKKLHHQQLEDDKGQDNSPITYTLGTECDNKKEDLETKCDDGKKKAVLSDEGALSNVDRENFESLGEDYFDWNNAAKTFEDINSKRNGKPDSAVKGRINEEDEVVYDIGYSSQKADTSSSTYNNNNSQQEYIPRGRRHQFNPTNSSSSSSSSSSYIVPNFASLAQKLFGRQRQTLTNFDPFVSGSNYINSNTYSINNINNIISNPVNTHPIPRDFRVQSGSLPNLNCSENDNITNSDRNEGIMVKNDSNNFLNTKDKTNSSIDSPDSLVSFSSLDNDKSLDVFRLSSNNFTDNKTVADSVSTPSNGRFLDTRESRDCNRVNNSTYSLGDIPAIEVIIGDDDKKKKDSINSGAIVPPSMATSPSDTASLSSSSFLNAQLAPSQVSWATTRRLGFPFLSPPSTKDYLRCFDSKGEVIDGKSGGSVSNDAGIGVSGGNKNVIVDRKQAAILHYQQQHQLDAVCFGYWNSALYGTALFGSVAAETCEQLRKLSRKYGIPAHLRALIWLTLSGVYLKMDENPGLFASINKTFGVFFPGGSHQAAIEKDLERTFPEHPYFKQPTDPSAFSTPSSSTVPSFKTFPATASVGVRRLWALLNALCWRNPLHGYCQSFNFIGAVLLLVIPNDDEAVFFLMCHLLENLLPNDYYGEDLFGLKVDQEVLVTLLTEYAPKISNHFQAIRFDIRALVPAWVMSLYINTFPIETVLRIFDFMLTENGTYYSVVPLTILIAFLKINQENVILKIDDPGDLLFALNHQASIEYDASKLIKTAHDLRLKPTTLHTIRRRVRDSILVTNEESKRQKARYYEEQQRSQQRIAGGNYLSNNIGTISPIRTVCGAFINSIVSPAENCVPSGLSETNINNDNNNQDDIFSNSRGREFEMEELS